MIKLLNLLNLTKGVKEAKSFMTFNDGVITLDYKEDGWKVLEYRLHEVIGTRLNYFASLGGNRDRVCYVTYS